MSIDLKRIIHMLLLIVFLSFHWITCAPTSSCEVCIIDSYCADDFIHFNISVSRGCKNPLTARFSYSTDIAAEKHYVNTTIQCSDCHVDLPVDIIHDAWDYTLQLESSELKATCSQTRKARCGGETSRLVWISAAGLSGLFILLGVLFCGIRYYRTRKQIKMKTQKIDQAVMIN